MKKLSFSTFQLTNLPYASFMWQSHKDVLHNHDFIEIYYLMNGKSKFCLNQNNIEMRIGEMYIITPKDSHACLCDSTTPIFQRNFLVKNTEFETMCNIFSPSLYKEILSKSPIVLHLSSNEFETFEQTFTALPLDVFESRSESYTIYKFILSRILEKYFFNTSKLHQNPNQSFVANIIQTINSPNGLHLSPSNHLSHYPHTKSYICKQFKHITGYTLSEYINIKRLEYAKLLIQTTSLSLSQIAEEVGYHYYPYFHKRFLAQFGCTPQSIR